MENFFYDAQFDRMKKEIAGSIAKSLAIETKRRQVRVNDVWVDDNKSRGDFDSQAKAIKEDKTWGVPVYASLDLVDKTTGKTISSTKKIRVATLPKNTLMGSFIIKGKHYQVNNQLRRKPGVYVLERENKEIESQFSVQGKQFSIRMDPATKRFMLHMGQSDQPLYPLLSRMGISDSMLARTWGEDVLAINKDVRPKRAESSIKTIAKNFVGQTYESADAAAVDVREHLANTKIAPEVVNRTLGTKQNRVTLDVLLKASGELLSVQRGDREPDEPQSIEFKKALSVADFVKERVEGRANDFRGRIARRLSALYPPTNIRKVVNVNEVSPVIERFFTQTELSNTPDQTNPVHMLNGISNVTIRGEGGIRSEHGIKESERALHPSHLGFIDPIHTPDSSKVGTTMHLAAGVQKTSDNELATPALDMRTGKAAHLTPTDIHDNVVAFPDQYDRAKKSFVGRKVKALVGGEIRMVNAKDVAYVMADPKRAFSVGSNLIPFLPSTQGNRTLMSTKMMEQAIPLAEREAPLVQSKLGNSTWEKSVGAGFSLRAVDDGVVLDVKPKAVTIQHRDGVKTYGLADNYPLNSKSFVHQEPVVAKGDAVRKGQVISDSNFTRGGDLAIGTNLKTAYIPYKGYNFEDGIVISESAAKKLTSEHLYQYADKAGQNAEFTLDGYMGWRPNDLDAKQQSKLNSKGIVRKGQILEKGDALWVGTKENVLDPDSIVMSKYTKLPPKKGFKKTWDHDVPGKVIDVIQSGDQVKVYVKTQEPAQVGDKLTNRGAAKGIVTKVLPDGEMPRTKDGNQVDVLMNPHAVVGRINPSQLLETMAGKIAEKSGKPYVVDNFSGEKYATKIDNELKALGLSDKEKLFDSSGKELGDVLVGKQYVLKLSKQATSQFSARASGRYDMNKSPLKGGEEGSKALDLLTLYAMLAHGSRANLKEMATYKATQNQEFWNWLQAGAKWGKIMPPPEPTFAYQKFESYLKAAGVDVKRKGSQFVLSPMTSKEVDKLSGGEVKEPLWFRAKDLQRIKGGLLDPIIHGSDDSNWSHYNLAEPVPNPIFEDPIRRLTGINKQQFNGLVHGKLYVDPKTGEFNEDRNGLTGGVAVKHLLKKVDTEALKKEWTETAQKTRSAAKRDEANKVLRYIRALEDNKLKPQDAYVMTKLPILPPRFRPVYPLPNGDLGYSGINNLYRDVGLVNNELKWQNEMPFIPDTARAELRENLYEGVKALTGIKGSNPITYYQPQRRPRGFVEEIKGQTAKTGFFQDKVLRRTQDLVGRGTIIPEPKLGVDEVGLPEDMAWGVFKPFVVRDLVGSGMDPNDALDSVEERSPIAKASLEAVMHERPVLLNRAPTLHKFGMMAFKPKITEGRAIKIPPLIVKGYNADFDGDTMTVHVPIMDDAVEEAKKMYPSKHLYNPGTGGLMVTPSHEASLGLYKLSKTPGGRKAIDEVLPEKLRGKYKVLDKKGMSQLLNGLIKERPNDYGKTVEKLKEMGDLHTYQTGYSVGLSDLLPRNPEKNRIISDMNRQLSQLDTTNPAHRDKAVSVIQKADDRLKSSMMKVLKADGNNFMEMVESGARGSPNQLKQIVSAPMLVDDHRGKPLPYPVVNSYAEGLPFSDYWSALYGARRVSMDKQLQTQEPGAFNKDIMASAVSTVVSSTDCNTNRGVKISTDSRDVEDRFLARDVKIGNSVVARAGDTVTSELLNKMRERKVKELHVRSPLTCSSPKGICSKCYGLDEHGATPKIGDNVGAKSGHALSEPLTQMTLRTFHTGGLSGTRNIISGYDKIDRLLKLSKIRAGKATLAEQGGTVTKKERAAGGVGANLYVNDKPHFVPQGAKLRVKVGSKVKKGDALTDGLIQAQQLAELKGILPAQEYVVDEIQKSYMEQGVPLKRRSVETIVRSIGNVTKVVDPGDSDFITHDVVPYTVAEDFNSKILGNVPVNDAVGKVLQEEVGNLKPGTPITKDTAKALRGFGKSKVSVSPKPIIHQPYLTGVGNIPLASNDWMAQLGYQHLEKAIVKGAERGRATDIHGYHPIPAFAYGAEFGDPFLGATEGKY